MIPTKKCSHGSGKLFRWILGIICYTALPVIIKYAAAVPGMILNTVTKLGKSLPCDLDKINWPSCTILEQNDSNKTLASKVIRISPLN